MFDKKAWNKNYNSLPYVKERKKLYRLKPGIKERDQQTNLKYRESEHGKKVIEVYQSSEEYKKVRKKASRKYANSDRAKQQHRKYRKNTRDYLITLLGGKCVNCGYCENIEGLELDHKNNDGKTWRSKFGGNCSSELLYHRIHPDIAIEVLQVLCGTCHRIKTNQENRTKYLVPTNE